MTEGNARTSFVGVGMTWLANCVAFLCLFSLMLGLASSPIGDEAKSSAEFVQRGDEAFELGRYSAAVEFYRSALKRDEGNFTVRLKLIELLARLAGREDEARKEMDVALGVEDLSPHQLRLLAEICSRNGFPEKAKLAYESLLEMNPDDLSALGKLIDALLSEKDFEQAREKIELYGKSASSTIEGLELIAAKCVEHWQYDLARIAYEGVLKRDEKNLPALLAIAECLVRLGKLSEAAEKLSSAAEGHPEQAAPSARLGMVFLRKGDYGRAEDAFGKALDMEPGSVEAADGYAKVMSFTGRYDEARQTLERALETNPDSPALLVSLGRLLNYVGEYELAGERFEKALAAKPGYAEAILGLGMTYWETGKLDLAREQLHSLYDFWDTRVDELDSVRPQDMLAVAIACALTDNPQDAIGVLEKALKKDPTNTDSLLWEGRLFAERHQPTDARRELQKVLAINPKHPEAHAELASIYLESSQFGLAAEACQQALKTNPRLIRALDLLSSIQILDFEYEKAEETVQKALAINPRSLSSLSHLASCYWQQRKKDNYEKVRREVFEINPVYGEFYLIVARACENKRRNEEAIELLKEAVALKADYAPAYTRIGILLMREGEEEEAEKYLRRSYRLDSYNPRTTNFINLLEHMKRNFVSTRTEHFLIKWEKEKGSILKYFLPEYLEEVYRAVCGEFGYEPKNPTLVEIFESHDQFSARIVGLPFIATVGASLGKVVAADSPKRASFDWKDVLRHEFVHVVNLQQSRMQIPFWLTEGLATHHEESPLPAEWDGLIQRMLYLGRIIPLADLNSYFTRPKTQMHKQAAYAESYLICRYLYEKFGREVIRKMIEMYGQDYSTEEVIPCCLGMSAGEFERKIQDYIFAEAKEKRIAPLFLPGDGKLIGDRLKDDPENSFVKVAQARWLYGRAVAPRVADMAKLDQATQILVKIIEENPRARGAYATLSEIHLARRKYEEAKHAALKAIAVDDKDFQARRCLGIAYERTNEIEEAIAELEKAIALYPRASGLWIALRLLYAKEEDEVGRARALEGLVRARPKNVRASKMLAGAYLSNDDHDRGIELLEGAIRYTLYDAEIYALLVVALEGKGSWKTARRYAEIGAGAAYLTAESLMPYQKERVLKLLKLALELNPSHEKAQSLLERIAQ